ncbi:MAG: AMP-binding protein [Spirochaetales bacterium]|nr:AMP-binding protein [Spirochaetales bacterium]
MEKYLTLDRLKSLWAESDLPVFVGEASCSWKKIEENIENISSFLESRSEKDWFLHTDAPDTFIIGFLSLLFSSKNIHLQDNYPEKGEFPVLTDSGRSEYSISALVENSIQGSAKNKFERNENCRVIFYTSGSTGTPKPVEKRFDQLDIEIETLNTSFYNKIKNSTFYSTVPHQHFYGFIFAFLLPVFSGCPVSCHRIQYPEGLESLPDGKKTIITSPAFLKRFADSSLKTFSGDYNLFSAGGFLPENVALKASESFHSSILEIYGSTEAGSMGWKYSPDSASWNLFSPHSLKIENGKALLKSPYLFNDGWEELDDILEWSKDNKFRLIGRKDSVVKVEEKRVALNDMERQLLLHPWVSDCIVLFFQEKRQYLGAVVLLDQNKSDEWGIKKKLEINNELRRFLKETFPPVVVPRKWRYPDEMPRNNMGKVKKAEALKLFEKNKGNSVNQPEIISKERDGNTWVYILKFPENYCYFEGHFPELKILPAVVQINWLLVELGKELDREIQMLKIPRIKMKSPIFPDIELEVSFSYDPAKECVAFNYKNDSTKAVCSTGKILLRENA